MFTALGLALRVSYFGASVFGDELSTLWIVRNNGLSDTIGVVASDAEITPPLYFILAWFASKIGSAPELVRLPSLVAGTISIPLTYLLGVRTVGRGAGLIGTLVMALSPFMIFFSANGRAYAVMICLLLCSSLAMLAATRTGHTRWWVAYAVAVCLAMYAHYTAAFVLTGQFLWLLWAHPEARRAALLASTAAAVGFLPWIGGFLADQSSPTVAVLEFLQAKGFDARRSGVEQMLFGQPLAAPERLPGKLAILLSAAGLIVAAIAAVTRYLRGRATKAFSHQGLKPAVLIAVLALATPLGEALLLGLGVDLFGARNLTSAWTGTPLLIGAVLTSAGLPVAVFCSVLTISGFTIGAVKMNDHETSASGYKAAAGFIDRNAAAGDVIVDSSHFTPVPLTQLDVHLSGSYPEYRLTLPVNEPPFLPLTAVHPASQDLVDQAFAVATRRGSRVIAVTPRPPVARGQESAIFAAEQNAVIPEGWRVEDEATFPGVRTVTVTVLDQESGLIGPKKTARSESQE